MSGPRIQGNLVDIIELKKLDDDPVSPQTPGAVLLYNKNGTFRVREFGELPEDLGSDSGGGGGTTINVNEIAGATLNDKLFNALSAAVKGDTLDMRSVDVPLTLGAVPITIQKGIALLWPGGDIQITADDALTFAGGASLDDRTDSADGTLNRGTAFGGTRFMADDPVTRPIVISGYDVRFEHCSFQYLGTDNAFHFIDLNTPDGSGIILRPHFLDTHFVNTDDENPALSHKGTGLLIGRVYGGSFIASHVAGHRYGIEFADVGDNNFTSNQFIIGAGCRFYNNTENIRWSGEGGTLYLSDCIIEGASAFGIHFIKAPYMVKGQGVHFENNPGSEEVRFEDFGVSAFSHVGSLKGCFFGGQPNVKILCTNTDVNLKLDESVCNGLLSTIKPSGSSIVAEGCGVFGGTSGNVFIRNPIGKPGELSRSPLGIGDVPFDDYKLVSIFQNIEAGDANSWTALEIRQQLDPDATVTGGPRGLAVNSYTAATNAEDLTSFASCVFIGDHRGTGNVGTMQTAAVFVEVTGNSHVARAEGVPIAIEITDAGAIVDDAAGLFLKQPSVVGGAVMTTYQALQIQASGYRAMLIESGEILINPGGADDVNVHIGSENNANLITTDCVHDSIGIGVPAPTDDTNLLNVVYSPTEPDTFYRTLDVRMSYTPSADSGGTGIAIIANCQGLGTKEPGVLIGLDALADHQGSADATTAIGVRAKAVKRSTGLVINAKGVEAQIEAYDATDEITYGYAIHVLDAVLGAGAKIDHQYGIVIERPTKGTTDKYALQTLGGRVQFNDGQYDDAAFGASSKDVYDLLSIDPADNALYLGGRFGVKGKLSFFDATPVNQPVLTGDFTNGVSAGGTDDQTDDFVVATTGDAGGAATVSAAANIPTKASVDAIFATIRNDIYQLSRTVRLLNNGLRDLGLFL